MRLLHWAITKLSRGTKFVTSLRKSSNQAIVTTPKPSDAAGLAKDVIVFKYDEPKFFKYINLFGFSQLGFWAFMAHSTTTLKDVPVPKEENQHEGEQPFYRRINLGDDSLRYSLLATYVFIGYAIVAATSFYTLRSIRYVVLRKDKRSVSVVTYTPFGKNRIIDVPLSYISASGSRAAKKTYMPLKIKGHRFFYLLDSKGHVPQPALFDRTIGVHRKWDKN